jgi:hypothetical protein
MLLSVKRPSNNWTYLQDVPSVLAGEHIIANRNVFFFLEVLAANFYNTYHDSWDEDHVVPGHPLEFLQKVLDDIRIGMPNLPAFPKFSYLSPSGSIPLGPVHTIPNKVAMLRGPIPYIERGIWLQNFLASAKDSTWADGDLLDPLNTADAGRSWGPYLLLVRMMNCFGEKLLTVSTA